jgi:hypothetical protein
MLREDGVVVVLVAQAEIMEETQQAELLALVRGHIVAVAAVAAVLAQLLFNGNR